MNIRAIITTLCILFLPAILIAEDTLPENIFIKNLSRGFSYQYLYALKDGRIWIKPNKINTETDGDWTLFNKTGIPDGKDSLSFKNDNLIREFSTEGTMIAAVSDAGRFYIWEPTIKENTAWADKTGSPFSDALYLPKNRTWCFSLSLMRAPWKRLTPMPDNDIVSYWEDIDGNKTEFGFTATVYVVDPDGQKIRYTDTGLPPSWHKAFTSPERGRFIIEQISASASTIFVIDKAGKMYTRMLDYEMEGGCPALKFVYEHGLRTHEDYVAPLMESIRTLPLPDWREQEPVDDVLLDPGGKAAITDNITILLTGKGNAARELRVQGRNRNGEYGYWKKSIFERTWMFERTDEVFCDNDIIKNYLSEAQKGIPLDKKYIGIIKKYGQADLPVELVDFYYYSTPCILRVHAGEKQLDLKFHTVDMWSPTVQQKNFPELVGNPSGEPKLLQGTIEIPPEILASEDPEVKKIVETWFINFNLVPFAFKVVADDGKVIITSRVVQRDLKNMNYEFRKQIQMELTNIENPTGVHTDMFYTSFANLPLLDIPDDWQTFEQKDLIRIDALIEFNQKSLKEMKDLLAKFKRAHLKAGSIAAIGSTAYYLFDGIINLIGLPYWMKISNDPGTTEDITQLGGLSYTGGTPMNEYAMMNLALSSKSPEDYERAVQIFDARISLLKKIRKNIISASNNRS